VLFPEAYLSGYSYRDLGALLHSSAQPLTGPLGSKLSALARQYEMVISAGMFEREGESLYNVQAVAFPDGRLERQRKGCPAESEKGLIALEPERQLFQWKGVRFAILVCADICLPDFRSQFRQLGISLLLHPTAGRIEACGEAAHQKLQVEVMAGFSSAKKLAGEMDVTYAVANPIGFSGEDYYPGNSWIVRPDGNGVHLPGTARKEEMVEKLAVTRIHEPV